MNIKMAAACVIVAGGFAGWYALSAGNIRSGPAPSHIVPAAPLDVRGTALANEVARLGRRQQPVESPQRARDLFRFAAAAPRKTVAAPIVLSVPAEPPAPPPPAFRLIGVAEDNAAGNPVRTAIISAPDQLYVVREGERVTSRYGVARISPDVVELVDTGDSTALRLALK
jgi:lipoprotein-anchoring transpeptidase ErfK/SrfK